MSAKPKTTKSATPKKTATKKVTSTAAAPRLVKPQPNADVKVVAPGRLFTMNKWLALFYGVEALAVGLFATSYALPVQISYLAKDELLSTKNDAVQSFAVHQLGTVRLGWVLFAWLAILAITHAVLATKLRNHQAEQVKRGGDTFGWIMGGVGAGIGAAILALLIGGNIDSMLALLGIGVAGGVVGWLSTRSGTQLRAGLATVTGLAVLAWVMLGSFVLGSFAFGSGALPAHTTITLGTTFVLSAAILTIIWLGYAKRASFADRVFTARMVMFGSFVLVTVMVAQLFAGFLW